MTADLLFARSSELGRCELIRGELRMMALTGGLHGATTAQLACSVLQWALDNGGIVYGAGTGFVLERNPDSVRAPDVAYIAEGRVDSARTPRYIPIAPDFIAEVTSPNDKAEEVAEKVQWWLDKGVRLVWVADPANRCVTTHLPNGDTHVYRADEAIPGGEVMPGLSVYVSKVFA